MILVPAAVPRTAPAFQRPIDPRRRPPVLAGLTIETLPPGAHVEQRSPADAEFVTVLLAGRLEAAGRILGPGEALRHPPGSACHLTALRGAPTAILTVQPVRVEEPGNIPAQRSSSSERSAWQGVAVTSVTLAAGEGHEPLRHSASDAFIVVLSGTGTLVGENGQAALFPGDLAYIRAGESHGLRADPQGPVTVLLGRVWYPAPSGGLLVDGDRPRSCRSH
ncbi:cupin domain-containing protein [Streptomyces sp. SP17BM10]|uniref:cupin domain-containing protein n=1 Tax=Streptomyces sp. SP17BM10 TaxID=3002530 RepID=UPI002E75C0DD|nr:cupin domain-containing protein [Streptomyces sp. SP17BM10]MEE1787591.1 cupin domain-containing protein [Streptomyces sp. SP17BM10]